MTTRVLYVHGLESGVNGFKARYLAKHFKESFCAPMINSRKGLWSSTAFEECLDIQSQAVQSFRPDVLVGSSFGGAIVLELIQRKIWCGPAVLLCPAHKLIARGHNVSKDEGKCETEEEVTPSLLPSTPYCLVHGKWDTVVPIQDTRDLARTGTAGYVRLIELDDTHGLRTLLGAPPQHETTATVPTEYQLRHLVAGLIPQKRSKI